MTQLLADIKAFCLAHYEEGYDSCVECWDDRDYVEFIEENNVKSVDDFVKEYAPVIGHANEIRSTAF